MTEVEDKKPHWKFSVEFLFGLNIIIPFVISALIHIYVIYNLDSESSHFTMTDIFLYVFSVGYAIFYSVIYYQQWKYFYLFLPCFPIFAYLFPTIFISMVFTFPNLTFFNPIKLLVISILAVLFLHIGYLIQREVL